MSSSSSWPPCLNMDFIVFSYVPSFPCTLSTPPNRKETRAEVPAPNHLVNAPSPPPSCIDHLAMHCWLVQWQCGIKQLHLYTYMGVVLNKSSQEPPFRKSFASFRGPIRVAFSKIKNSYQESNKWNQTNSNTNYTINRLLFARIWKQPKCHCDMLLLFPWTNIRHG